MSEDKLESAINRGSQASALLNSDLLKEIFAALERDYIEAWKVSHARDTEAREKLFIAVNVVGKVRDHLVIVANNGKLAQRQLDELIKNQTKGKS